MCETDMDEAQSFPRRVKKAFIELDEHFHSILVYYKLAKSYYLHLDASLVPIAL